MKPEKQQLIQDVMDHDSARESTLVAGVRILRRRRHWRVATRSAAVLAVISLATAWGVKHFSMHTALPQISNAVSTPQVQPISDDQLLALFPTNTPVGLASLADGKKRLIFPRRGDEAKFITRL